MPPIRVVPDVVAERLAGSVADAWGSPAGSPADAEKAWAGLVELGVPAFAVPIEADGLDLGQGAAVLVATELGRAAAGWPYLDGVLAADLLAGGLHTGAGRENLLRRLATGDLLPYSAGMSGSGLASALDGDGWVLASAGLPRLPDQADALLVRFRDGDRAPVALVARGRGPAGAHVRVPRDAVIAAGLPQAVLDRARVRQAAHLLGTAAAAVGLATVRAAQRQQFGQPLASYQAVALPLAALWSRLDAAQLLVQHTAWQQDGSGAAPGAGAAALATAIELALDAVRQAVHTHGATGLIRHSPVDRLHRYVLAEAPRWGAAHPLWQEAGAARPATDTDGPVPAGTGEQP